ncbi:polysaccharide lyase family 7 protein [Gilvimarinus japonicus]|uniref:Polysaccharide lyase family 7 protein n=1 Tax=Gilvimarinus japonicus TaxID=1796469 RepID=A0ABV7HK00_9GAMM
MPKKSALKKTLAVLSTSMLGLTLANSAMSCSSASFNWSSEWDSEFTSGNYKSLQYPRTSTCISGSSLNNRKVNGHFFQQDGHAVFDNDDGDDGRTEIRSQNMSGSHSAFEARFQFEGASLSTRQYTVGQMFGEGYGPIIRMEQSFGKFRAVVKPDPNGSSQKYGEINVNRGTWYTYKMVRSGNTAKVWINGNEVTPNGGVDISDYDQDKTYYKAGCYMNNSTQANGCRAKFDKIKYNR